MTVLYIFLAIGSFVISYFVAKEFQSIAIDKGYREEKYFWWSFFLGPAGWAMVIALPRVTRERNDNHFETLAKLSYLHEDGALSDEEYKKLKADCIKKIGG